MLHGTLTVVTRIRPSKVEALESLLKEVDQRIRQGQPHPFEQVDGLYFGRWGILSPGPDGERLLALGMDFSTEDGRYRKRLNEFLTRFVDALAEHRREPGAQAFDAIYRTCVGYPAKGLRKPTRVREFLQAHSVHFTARHVDFAYRVETATGMRRLLALSEAVEHHLNTSSNQLEELVRDGPDGLERVQHELHERIQEDRSVQPDPEWHQRWDHARRSAARATLLYPALRYLVAVPTVGLFMGIGWLEKKVRGALRRRASTAEGPAARRAAAMPRYVREPQGQVQNPMIHVAMLEPGVGNRIALWMTLRSVNLRLRRYVAGLSHIRVIHCARWVILKTKRRGKGALFRPRTRRLLFFTNYDGSWESYIDSFIDDAEVRSFLVSIWKDTEDFPARAKGRPFLEPFKAWIHQKQVPTRVWYSAHFHRPEGRVEPAINDLHHVLQLRGLLARDSLSAPEPEETLRSFLSRGVFSPGPELMRAREWLSYILTRRAPREPGRRLTQWRDHVAKRAITRLRTPTRPAAAAALPPATPASRAAAAPGRHPGARASWLQGHGRRLLPAAEDRGPQPSPDVAAGDTP
ncbi:hypothetical protein [Hyalangium versicolor]|uniref:hypothetical protein n=1 Tax=Hyalangium versicolor TaxID=2861190 RepID=UPI001CCAA968|nr:hypothetical protein [Hyalangium versicolor]